MGKFKRQRTDRRMDDRHPRSVIHYPDMGFLPMSLLEIRNPKKHFPVG